MPKMHDIFGSEMPLLSGYMPLGAYPKRYFRNHLFSVSVGDIRMIENCPKIVFVSTRIPFTVSRLILAGPFQAKLRFTFSYLYTFNNTCHCINCDLSRGISENPFVM